MKRAARDSRRSSSSSSSSSTSSRSNSAGSSSSRSSSRSSDASGERTTVDNENAPGTLAAQCDNHKQHQREPEKQQQKQEPEQREQRQHVESADADKELLPKQKQQEERNVAGGRLKPYSKQAVNTEHTEQLEQQDEQERQQQQQQEPEQEAEQKRQYVDSEHSNKPLQPEQVYNGQRDTEQNTRNTADAKPDRQNKRSRPQPQDDELVLNLSDTEDFFADNKDSKRRKVSLTDRALKGKAASKQTQQHDSRQEMSNETQVHGNTPGGSRRPLLQYPVETEQVHIHALLALIISGYDNSAALTM